MGYLVDRTDSKQGRARDFALKSILAREGATPQEHDLFVFLSGNSLILEDGPRTIPYNDSRSGQAALFGFPFVVQVFLSLILRQQEDTFINCINNNLNLPVINSSPSPLTVLSLATNITKFPISFRVGRLIDDSSTTILDEARLAELQFVLGTSESLNFSELLTIEDKLNHIFDTFRVNATYKQFYIDIVKVNDKVRAASLIAQLLNYDKFTVQRLAQFFDQWQSSQSI